MTQWLTIGMSAYRTPGFQDTSRLMTNAFHGGDAVYIEPPQPFRAWKHVTMDNLRWKEWKSREISVLSPPLPIPSKLDLFNIGRSIYGRKLATHLVQLFGRDWRRSTIVYMTNWTPYLIPLVETIQPHHVVFDLVDDVLSFPYSWKKSAIVESWQRLAHIASLILGVSPAMCEQSRELFGKNAEYCPNGVDKSFFYSACKHIQLPDVILHAPKGTRIGFAGTLNHWIDYESITRIAKALPQKSIFLLGKTGNFGSEDVKQSYEKTKSVRNIHHLGPIEYEVLPAYLNAMDVLIIPRKEQKSSEASSPLKLYEYLAIGKPIVASGVPIPEDLNLLVYSADTKDTNLGIVRAVQNAFLDKDSNIEKRKQYAKNHTFESRVEFVQNFLQL